MPCGIIGPFGASVDVTEAFFYDCNDSSLLIHKVRINAKNSSTMIFEFTATRRLFCYGQ
jgi:hypothetical protein